MVGPWGGFVGPTTVIAVELWNWRLDQTSRVRSRDLPHIILRERFWKSELPLPDAQETFCPQSIRSFTCRR